jgi:hypothetical protein
MPAGLEMAVVLAQASRLNGQHEMLCGLHRMEELSLNSFLRKSG